MSKAGEERATALFVYGSWLRVRRRPGTLPPDLADPISLTAAERLIGSDAEEIYGLLPQRPITCAVFGEGGYVGEWPIEPVIEGVGERIDWRGDGWTLYAQEATHGWAEQIGAWEAGPAGLRFRPVTLLLPHGPPCALLQPLSDRGTFTFLFPPFKEGEGFRQDARITAFDAGGIVVAAAHPAAAIKPFTSAHDEATARYLRQLDRLFSALRADRIFGMDIYGAGWAPSEGWDVVAEQVPPELRQQWGWHQQSDMSLCWSAVAALEQDAREEAASILYNPTGWHEEYQARVDDWLLPSPHAITRSAVHFDGPDEAERQRIGAAIVARAAEVGFGVRWEGDPRRAAELWLNEPEPRACHS